MNELHAILRAADELDRLGEPAILATVVRVEGSSYRRPGARMLATVLGRRIGSVSGGCLERDVVRQAWTRTQDGSAILLTYDATAEDDGLWGLGLGCNGKIYVLAQRLTPGDAHKPLRFLRDALSACRDCVVITVFSVEGDPPAQPGDQLLVDSAENAFDPHGLAESLNLADVIEGCRASRRTNVRRLELATGTVDILIECVTPPLRLLIAGGGFDAVPLAAAGKALGWHITVTDARASHATSEHFPDADELLVCAPADIATRCRVDDQTYVVVMTHRYADDLASLPGLLASAAPYVGLLGPEHRRQQLLADLAEEFLPTPRQLAKLHGPIGLDIGADNPVEIAASIVAEIIAVRSGRNGGPLRDANYPIHDRVPMALDLPAPQPT